MKQYKARYILPALALLLLGTVLGMKLEASLSDSDTYDQLQKLENAFVIINQRYVDEVRSSKTAEDAIKGMLDGLDPHSTYISAEEIKRVQESYQGSFGGVGIWFEPMGDTARVISTISDGPSEKVGVMPGDRIVGINDSSAIGLSSDGIQERLKGPIGTEVDMTVYRPHLNREVTFTLERAEIPLHSIETAQMLDEETGYIEITRFAMTTYDEFMEAMKELRAQGMERLVLDLRRNPGGVMETAVEIADEFLHDGQTIVETKGRSDRLNQELKASAGGSFEGQPLIVLVSPFSASASEILAGALQDHDRALIVGQRTFGKGLVQNQFPLPDESVLQLTVARYYTPAGRLIQTPYENGAKQDYYENKFASFENGTFNVSDYRNEIPDSLIYETDHGREVYGGGGILPDYLIDRDSSLVASIHASRMDQAFAREWFNEREQQIRDEWGDRPEAFVENFTVDEAMWNAFWEFAREQEDIRLTEDPAEVSEEDKVYSAQEVDEERERLETYLKFRLAQTLYGSRSARSLELGVDPEVNEALTLWNRAQELAAYHTAGASPGSQ